MRTCLPKKNQNISAKIVFVFVSIDKQSEFDDEKAFVSVAAAETRFTEIVSGPIFVTIGAEIDSWVKANQSFSQHEKCSFHFNKCPACEESEQLGFSH